MKKLKINLVDMIIDFESGELKAEDTIVLFGELVRTGQAWTLQGCYGRTASQLIKDGYISTSGEVLKPL